MRAPDGLTVRKGTNMNDDTRTSWPNPTNGEQKFPRHDYTAVPTLFTMMCTYDLAEWAPASVTLYSVDPCFHLRGRSITRWGSVCGPFSLLLHARLSVERADERLVCDSRGMFVLSLTYSCDTDSIDGIP